MEDEEAPLAVELGGLTNPKQSSRGGATGGQVPVTVITGFLGSGKTTLVRHVLTAEHGYKIAVILNEYGEDVGIESSFVQDEKGLQGRDGEWIELTNGCMCCSVKADFVQALETLLERKDGFDYIVIETTGLANPGPIATALWTDEEVEARVHLDSVVTVVDALNINRQLHEHRADGTVNEAQLQIAYADLVILNKLDLAEEEAITRAEADIRAINSTVNILRTEHSKVDLGLLLNRNGYSHKGDISLPPIAEEAESFDGGAEEEGTLPHASSTPGLHCCSSRAHSMHGRTLDDEVDKLGTSPGPASGRGSFHRALDDHTHDTSISTLSLRTDKPVALEKFKKWVDHLLWDREARPDEIYRMKGLLCVEGSEQKHSLQAVYEMYDIIAGPLWKDGEQRSTRVVLIGKNLKESTLRSDWSRYLEG